jgi:hypothetical protein
LALDTPGTANLVSKWINLTFGTVFSVHSEECPLPFCFMDLGCATFISITVSQVLNKLVIVSIYDEQC